MTTPTTSTNKKCFCCHKQTKSIITIEGSTICIHCYEENYSSATIVRCNECGCYTSAFHGQRDEKTGFICSTCIMNSINEMLENDPAHSNIPIFSPPKVKKNIEDMTTPLSDWIRKLRHKK